MKLVKNFFIEEDLKVILAWLGIDYKKAMKNRIILSCFFAFITLFLGIYFKNVYIGVASIFVGFGYYKYQYFSVKKILFLIRTNNVYTSLI